MEEQRTVKMPINRKSGIELLKLIGILAIILSHCVQSIQSLVPFLEPSNSISFIALRIIRQMGTFGNLVFVISSSYFLLDKERTNDSDKTKKAFGLLLDSQFISIAIYLVFIAGYIAIRYQFDTSVSFALTQLFPDLFNQVWFVPAYVLLYLLSPYLNRLIFGIEQKTHFRICVSIVIVYILLGTLGSEPAFSDFLGFVLLYFITAYIKQYRHDLFDNYRKNIIQVIICFVLWIIITASKSILGLKLQFFELYPRTEGLMSIVFVPMIFGLFGLFLRMSFVKTSINYLSSLSLFIYCIHENYLVRSSIRPRFYSYCFSRFGSSYYWCYIIVLWLTVVILSFISAMIYKATVHRFTKFFSSILYDKYHNFVELLYKRSS